VSNPYKEVTNGARLQIGFNDSISSPPEALKREEKVNKAGVIKGNQG
jgi:hypothetical protein